MIFSYDRIVLFLFPNDLVSEILVFLQIACTFEHPFIRKKKEPYLSLSIVGSE